jgi:NADH-quinone oxidoreductase subunit C
MTTRLETLAENLKLVLGDKLSKTTSHVGEITIECKANELLDVCHTLRDHAGLKFEQLMDLCGVDYAEYGDGAWNGPRFAVVYHLLSISLNHRVRLRVYALDEDFPVLPTVAELWPVANWFEREAFDL